MLDLPQPQEASMSEEYHYVDDWAEARIYKYVQQLHYEKLVKKGLISSRVEKRPDSSQS